MAENESGITLNELKKHFQDYRENKISREELIKAIGRWKEYRFPVEEILRAERREYSNDIEKDNE